LRVVKLGGLPDTVPSSNEGDNTLTALNNHQLLAAKRVAGSAPLLGAAALDLRTAIESVLSAAQGNPAIVIGQSRTGVDLNFAVGTPHGVVEALFDHVFKDDELVGRYRFFLVEKEATGNAKATEILTLLFDANHNATSDPLEQFDWNFRSSNPDYYTGIGTFLLNLLANIQATFHTY
jgi:hypothetical protein